MSVCWTPMCEILVSKMFVCAMPYVLVPVVLQWEVIVLDDCVPDVFVMGAFSGCLFYVSVCIMSVCRIYILHVHSMTGWRFWVCSISVCLMPKFEMSVCRMSVINVCLGNDCEALISFLWWDLLSAMPLCGISVCEWLSSVCVSPGFLSWMNVYWITVWRMSKC